MEGVRKRIPHWIKSSIPGGDSYTTIKRVVAGNRLNTVCIEARCPNRGECFSSGQATFLILGSLCTRNCKYCAVAKGDPLPPDADEPERVASAIAELNLDYAVITSVTRDDIPDGGASFFASTIRKIRELREHCAIEVLVPDFAGSMGQSIDTIASSKPDVINHNIEVTKNFYQKLRPMGSYKQSLQLIHYVSKKDIPVKSGFMIGFGETMGDIQATIEDLYNSGCSHITVGQYLQSRIENYPVEKYYHPEEFREIAEMAATIGIKKIQCAPLVRSSYHAKEFNVV